MSLYALSPDLWQQAEESDRRFKRLLRWIALPALVFALVVPLLHIAGLVKGPEALPARYAELLQQKAEPAPKPEQPKPKEEKKEQPKPAEKPKPTEEQKIAKAREKVSKLTKAFDQLADLRDTHAPRVDKLQTFNGNILTASPDTSALQSAAVATSGGIGDTGRVQRGLSATGIGERNTSAVQSSIAMARDANAGGSDKRVAGRTIDEINLVFDRRKVMFLSIYQRALRDNPNLAGKIVISLTIAPDGSVTDCKVVGSAGTDPEFERKIIAAVKLLNFGAKAVPPITFASYPIYLL